MAERAGVNSPKDKEEDRVCKKPEDAAKDAVLVATGDSVTSAYHQTASADSTDCTKNNSAQDARKLPGNDMMFSYAGRYYNMNKNISEYYNFARVGFSTDDIIKAGAAKTDSCANPWNRVKPPLDLADDAVKAAKRAGKKAFFVTTGGINNTNWTTILTQFALCQGLEVLTDAFKATVFSTNQTSFQWWAKQVLPGKPDKIIDNGGGCRATWWVNRGPFWPPLLLNPIRIGIPAYDGPGSGANESALSKQIPGDAKTIVNTMLAAGADKVVWMLYYSIIPATVDLKAAVSDVLGSYPGIKYLKNIVPAIFNLGDASLVPVALVGRIRQLEKDLNDAIKAQLPVNAKLVAQPAPALGAGDIQKTVPMGCPHPNGKGHDKLAAALKAAIGE
ncbi:hypothetical protein Rhe02_69670 [Rhizocola hellebori]|uniref:Uncharacterized protein n=2 Tax=Rhizocola hellebori TaxID=1392758 RepID=A0A8J3QFU2_9ACTN|nr:hypothetical protein Rhe02_69670 [Rhizocola hellebori]